MARNVERDELVSELRALGRGASPEPSRDVVASVMTRVTELPTPPRVSQNRLQLLGRWIGDAFAQPRRRVGAVAAAALLALVATPPVRAAVVEWFEFAGVVVRSEPGAAPSQASEPPAARPGTSLEDAMKLVTFVPVVPAALGAPDAVEVSPDRRVLSMSWSHTSDGTVRIDQFDGSIDPVFLKTAPRALEIAGINDRSALWFEEPHRVVVLNRDGSTRNESARLAGHTLIWEREGITLRLEGDVTLERAVQIAESTAPPRRH